MTTLFCNFIDCMLCVCNNGECVCNIELVFKAGRLAFLCQTSAISLPFILIPCMSCCRIKGTVGVISIVTLQAKIKYELDINVLVSLNVLFTFAFSPRKNIAHSLLMKSNGETHRTRRVSIFRVKFFFIRK